MNRPTLGRSVAPGWLAEARTRAGDRHDAHAAGGGSPHPPGAGLGRVRTDRQNLAYAETHRRRTHASRHAHSGESRRMAPQPGACGLPWQTGRNDASVTEKDKKISWARWALSSMSSCSGTPSTWRRRSRSCVGKVTPYGMKMSHGCRRCSTTTSTCWDAIRSRCRRP